MRLTELACKKSTPKEKAYKLFDGGGLYLEIRPTGGKHWKLKYYYLGIEKKLSIGEYPFVSLKDARECRDNAKKQLNQHIDPVFAKQEAIRQKIADCDNTLEAIGREWFEANKSKWSPGHSRSILSRLEIHVFPRLGKYPIRSITPPVLLKALKEIEKLGIYESTKRAKQYCSQIFRYAVVTGRVDRDITVDLKGALIPPKVKHHAALDINKVPEFLNKLTSNDARLFLHTRVALEMMLLTFTRTSELLEAKWSEFDLEDKMWTIPQERMKVKTGSHLVPLSRQVLEHLKRLKAQYGQWEHVFPSPISPKKPMSENTILYGLYRLGYKGEATGHGFRSLALSTIKEKLGYRHEVPDRQLAHSPKSNIDRAYDRAQFLDERIVMMQEWADYIDKIRLNENIKLAA